MGMGMVVTVPRRSVIVCVTYPPCVIMGRDFLSRGLWSDLILCQICGIFCAIFVSSGIRHTKKSRQCRFGGEKVPDPIFVVGIFTSADSFQWSLLLAPAF